MLRLIDRIPSPSNLANGTAGPLVGSTSCRGIRSWIILVPLSGRPRLAIVDGPSFVSSAGDVSNRPFTFAQHRHATEPRKQRTIPLNTAHQSGRERTVAPRSTAGSGTRGPQ